MRAAYILALVSVAVPEIATADINTSTGATTLVGALDSNMGAFDLAAYNGNLYTYDQTANLVRELSPTTGHTLSSISIGPSLIGEGGFAINSSGSGFIAEAQANEFFSFQLSPPEFKVAGKLKYRSRWPGV